MIQRLLVIASIVILCIAVVILAASNARLRRVVEDAGNALAATQANVEECLSITTTAVGKLEQSGQYCSCDRQ